jgi:acyl dehydratase
MISVWFRPHHWSPGQSKPALPLQVHFDLKALFDLPEAVMTDNTIVFHAPVRLGDRLRTHQVLRSVSDEKTTKLGTGRFWVIDVVYRNQHDELVGVESYTGFGYRRSTP